jgi:hypothetical protein
MLPKLKAGLLLFYKYARPCADDLEMTGKIQPADFAKIKGMASGEIEPSKSLLKRCFRSAVSNYKKSCRENQFEANFSPESVADHWRHHHGHTDDCAVKIATIFLVNGEQIKAAIDGEEKPVINLYGFKMKRGDDFFVHRRVLIERAD